MKDTISLNPLLNKEIVSLWTHCMNNKDIIFVSTRHMKDTISLNPILNKEIISLSAHCATSRLTENYISSSPVSDLCNM